jgi:hypothetical protein
LHKYTKITIIKGAALLGFNGHAFGVCKRRLPARRALCLADAIFRGIFLDRVKKRGYLAMVLRDTIAITPHPGWFGLNRFDKAFPLLENLPCYNKL